MKKWEYEQFGIYVNFYLNKNLKHQIECVDEDSAKLLVECIGNIKSTARFVFETKEAVEEREEKSQEEADDFMKDTITSMPIEVTTDNLMDGSKIVTTMSLSQLHILEQMALKMCADPNIFATLPFSFYKNILKVFWKRFLNNMKRRIK